MQIGGSDQWGNIVNGVDLIRRKQKKLWSYNSINYFSLWSKMGKTESERFGLLHLLSPYDYWQFWRNTDDRDVERF